MKFSATVPHATNSTAGQNCRQRECTSKQTYTTSASRHDAQPEPSQSMLNTGNQGAFAYTHDAANHHYHKRSERVHAQFSVHQHQTTANLQGTQLLRGTSVRSGRAHPQVQLLVEVAVKDAAIPPDINRMPARGKHPICVVDRAPSLKRLAPG